MPVSTRQTAATSRPTKAPQQSKLNFGAKKPNTIPIKDIKDTVSIPPAKATFHGTALVHSIPSPEAEDELEKKEIDDEEEEEQSEVVSKVELPGVQGEVNEPAVVTEDPTLDNSHPEAAESDQLDQDSELLFQEVVIERPVIQANLLPDGVADKAFKVTDEEIKRYLESLKERRITKTGRLQFSIFQESFIYITSRANIDIDRAKVHQEGLSDYEKILRHFDHSDYGPSVGITRFRRWNRAYRFQKNPPVEVLAVLLKSELGEGSLSPPETWKPAPLTAREGVGAVAHVNDLLATGTD
ncbi:hypothetical protein ABW19_dt0203054 [Dactylella cylindrospora]|nr:hypothetical protein ABW19_dt0203054 [Dactylella cylindrospora]